MDPFRHPAAFVAAQPAADRVGGRHLPLVAVLGMFLPISVAVAVVRYRLWDVDVIIRRTLLWLNR